MRQVFLNWEKDLIEFLWDKCAIYQIAQHLKVSGYQIKSFAIKYNIGSKGGSKTPVGHRQTPRALKNLIDTAEKTFKAKPRAMEPYNPLNSEEERYRCNKSEQLCWSCALATGAGDCEWANKGQPVPGWEAEPYQLRQKIKGVVRMVDTYTIISCPKFISDVDKPTTPNIIRRIQP